MFDFRAISVCAVLALAACATPMPPKEAQSALTEQTLQQAAAVASELVVLEKLKQPSKADFRRRARLRDQLWQFEREVIRAAIRLEQQDEWTQAEQVFRLATKAVPDSHILRFARFQFADRRAEREEVLRAELAIHRGEQLLQNASAYEALQRVTPVNFLTWIEVNAYERRRMDAATTLKRYADKALKRDDHYLARRCLSLSFRLHEDADVKKNLMLADAYIRDIRQRIAMAGTTSKTNAVVGDRKPDAELLVGEFYDALQKDDFFHARRYLSVLSNEYPRHRNLISMNSQYRLKLNRRVNEAIEQGKVLYSEGKVKEALRVWRKAEPLAPKNVELLSGIERAEKVLHNLRVLTAKNPADHSS